MTEPAAAKLEQIALAYQAGKTAFERGQYREAVQTLIKARALANQNSRLGGEIQIWLVTAYEAVGQQQEAIALCRQLNRHPDLEIRQQSRRLLYILEAPQLTMRPEWVSQIPDLSSVADSDPSTFQGRASSIKIRPPRQAASPESADLSQVDTQDNQFLWLALIALGLIVGGIVWLS